MVRCDTPFIKLVYSVMENSVTFGQDFDVQFLQARTPDIAGDMQSSGFIQDASLFPFCRYNRIAELSLKINIFSRLLLSIASNIAAAIPCPLVDLNDFTLFSSNEEDSRLHFMAADSCTNHLTLSFSFHSFSTLSKRSCCLCFTISMIV